MISHNIMTGFYPILGLTFAGSFFTCLFIILTEQWHGKLSHDHDIDARQKIHKKIVPRIGGVGVAMGLVIASLIYQKSGSSFISGILLCVAPSFIVGLQEDLTKKVRPYYRLIISVISGGLAWFFLDVSMPVLGFLYLDFLIDWMPISLLLTALAIAGISHGFNLIDGFHGLSVSYGIFAIGYLALISFVLNTPLLMQICLIVLVSLLGFIFFNWPSGQIFLGDGGAYLLGFLVSTIALILVGQVPNVSPWVAMVACMHPVIEVFYTIYRRVFVSKNHFSRADKSHLHHLIYYRVCRKIFHGRRVSSNACVALIYLPSWLCLMGFSLIDVENSLWQIFLCLAYVVLYAYIYGKLAKFDFAKRKS